MILSVNNLSIEYNKKIVVKDINFDLPNGKILAIVGESGSGKSTILKAIAGLLPFSGKISSGEIFYNGKDITFLSDIERRKLAGSSIGMIFQNATDSFCPIRNVGDQIYEAVKEHKKCSYDEFLENAKKIMKKINLDESVLEQYPFKLSGGMGQRVGILSAMILNPKLLLADEPTSALDIVTQLSVVEELMNLRKENNLSIVIVTHHLGVAYYMADYVLVMKKGCQIEFGTKEDVFYSPKKDYTRELIEAVK